MLKVEEENKTEAGGLSHLQKKTIKFDQELSGSLIYKEERILRFMEEQEIPVGSGRVYQFIPAKRNDTVRNTGRPKYLPVKICEDDGANCELIVKHNAVRNIDRRKRGVFSNLGALHNLARIEDIDVEEYMD